MRTARRCAAAGLILVSSVLASPGPAQAESPETRRWWDRMDRQDLEDRLERIERIERRRLEIEESRRSQELEERENRDRQERRQRWELKETWPTGRGLGDPRSPALRGDDR